MRLALAGEAEAVYEGLRAEGFVREGVEIDPAGIHDYVQPMLEPIRQDTFRFTRAWLRKEGARVADPRSPASQLGRKLNLPATYMLLHRVTIGGVGVLCQLEAEAPFRGEMERWLPGFTDRPQAHRRRRVEPPADLPTPDQTSVVEPGEDEGQEKPRRQNRRKPKG